MPNETQMLNSMPSVTNPKHLRSFWPLFIVVVIAFIAGAILMYVISDTERQEEINAIIFNKSKPFNHEGSGKMMPK